MFYLCKLHRSLKSTLYTLLQCRFKHTCSVNEQFFEKWSKNNAYIIGLLFADGCVCESKKGFQLSLVSSCKEAKFVENIAKKMESTHNIGLYKSNIGRCYHVWRVYSKKMCLDLIDKGCHPRKSLTLTWPNNIPNNDHQILSNFILGYFDGDGSISLTNKGSLQIRFAGTEAFLYQLQQQLQRNVTIKGRGSLTKKPNENCWVLQFDGNQTPLAIHQFMYQYADFDIILKRKYETGKFFQSVNHLSMKDRALEFKKYKNSSYYQSLVTCQVPNHKCPAFCFENKTN